MSLSGSYNWKYTRHQIITRAFQMAQIYSLGSTISAEDMDYAVDILNGLMKQLAIEGVMMWKRRQATLFTEKNVSNYSLGDSGANCTNSYVSTTTSSAAASGASAVVVTSSSGMAANDYIGITLDDGTRQWTTIASIGGTTVNLNTTLTDDVASGNSVVTYTTKINRPLRIFRANKGSLSQGNETSLMMISYDDYFDTPIKTTAGAPNNFYYDKLIDNGTIYLYPRPDNVDYTITFTYHDMMQDADTNNDDLDFPQEWMHPMTLFLAVELCYAYERMTIAQILEPKAEKTKWQLKVFDNDEESLKINTKKL